MSCSTLSVCSLSKAGLFSDIPKSPSLTLTFVPPYELSRAVIGISIKAKTLLPVCAFAGNANNTHSTRTNIVLTFVNCVLVVITADDGDARYALLICTNFTATKILQISLSCK